MTLPRAINVRVAQNIRLLTQTAVVSPTQIAVELVTVAIISLRMHHMRAMSVPIAVPMGKRKFNPSVSSKVLQQEINTVVADWIRTVVQNNPQKIPAIRKNKVIIN